MKYCTCCGTRLVVDGLDTFDEYTGVKKTFTRCPNGCDIFPHECKYWHGCHKWEGIFMKCRCGARYPDNNPIKKYGETGREIAKRLSLDKLPLA